MVYPTERALGLSYGITASKRAANTWKTNPSTLNHSDWETGCCGLGDAIGRNKESTPSRAVVIVDAGQCSGSALARCWTNSPPIRFEGSVVDYLAFDG